MRQPASRFCMLAVLLAVALSASTGCSGERDYDDEVRDAFLTACEYDGSPSLCFKMLECIEDHLTQSEFEYEDNIIILTGMPSERLVDIVAQCL